MATLDTHVTGVRRRDGRDHSARAGADSVRLARGGWILLQRVLMAAALALLIGLAVLPRLGLYRPVTVLSGSMRPTFAPGDMVLVTPELLSAVRVGQVISFQVPTGARQVETHRVIRIVQGGAHPVIQTKGDANNWPDPWTARLEGSTAWRLSAVVPQLGYVVNFLRGPAVRLAAIFIAPALLALLILFEIWGPGNATPSPSPKKRQTEGLPFVIASHPLSGDPGETRP